MVLKLNLIKANIKMWVLRLDLTGLDHQDCLNSEVRISSGKLFQSLGDATAKAWSPHALDLDLET